MPWLRTGVSKAPLWSLILAKTAGLSWLGEVNRLVCVTGSQVATILIMVTTILHPLPLWPLGTAPKPPYVELDGGWGGGGVNKNCIVWHPEISLLVEAGGQTYSTKIIPYHRWGTAEPGLGLTSGGLFVWAPGTS